LRRVPQGRVTSLDRESDLVPLTAADTVVLAAPVDAILQLIPRLRALAPRALLLIDVGSTKSAIVREAARAGLDRFVGGHPMAGGTSTGPGEARADLFDGRPWFLVRGSALEEPVARARRFVEALGGTPIEFSDHGEEHDRVVAAISHLPQVVATALLARVGEAVGRKGLAWAGNGLRDTTRLAASSPDTWRGILATNAAALAPLLRALAADVAAIADRLDEPGAVDQLFTRARAWLPEPRE
jgi:prephenate dehydrogenase